MSGAGRDAGSAFRGDGDIQVGLFSSLAGKVVEEILRDADALDVAHQVAAVVGDLADKPSNTYLPRSKSR